MSLKQLLKRYSFYLLRWQLSTPILAVCLVWLKPFGNAWATVAANLIGGLIFFWVDRYIFYYKSPIWEVADEVSCVDCGAVRRGYRLVKTGKYDRSDDPKPEFRCEECSIRKYEKLKKERAAA